MIYRKWSLLTGTAIMTGGLIGTLTVTNFLLVEKDPFVKAAERKRESALTKWNLKL